ncbi:amidoligase family protein [Litoribrevibacter albus]|uniref:Amidoligase enzyme n=1 Tax=Litoribrevibacter albus TaxID=1473156 RepID=A0AA37S8Y2_9GAMM|nr:amidoligase family protein [Litoribrevibacter albus]GLQ30758.1 hypothetical protein GCM10007876_12370 [Litoribrevibacter albus]
MDMPPVIRTQQGQIRKVGVELEFVGIELSAAVDAVVECFGGSILANSDYDIRVKDSRLGSFRIEYDSSYLKSISKADECSGDSIFSRFLRGKEHNDSLSSKVEFEGALEPGLMERLFRSMTSLEVVSPPINITELYVFNQLIERLHKLGAKGTRNQPLRALGLHFNPEVVSLGVDDLLPVLKAFLCLYERLVILEDVDVVRKIYPYIQPFPQDYVKLVVDPRYNPPLDLVVLDYLKFNPTRNRPLDLLPVFMTVLPELVEAHVDSSLVSARPTFHYRLPNSEIDRPMWSLTKAWNHWVLVERLAYDAESLEKLCRMHTHYFDGIQQLSSSSWKRALDDVFMSPDFLSG